MAWVKPIGQYVAEGSDFGEMLYDYCGTTAPTGDQLAHAAGVSTTQWTNLATVTAANITKLAALTGTQLTALATVTGTELGHVAAITGTQYNKIRALNATLTATVLNYALSGASQKLALVYGSTKCTNTATINPSGIGSVLGFCVSQNGAGTPTGCSQVTAKATATNSIKISRWKHTSAGTTTNVIATVAGTVNYLIFGRIG